MKTKIVLWIDESAKGVNLKFRAYEKRGWFWDRLSPRFAHFTWLKLICRAVAELIEKQEKPVEKPIEKSEVKDA